MKHLTLLLVVVAVQTGLWSISVPIFEFPDEQAHFAQTQFLVEQGRLPHGREFDLSYEVAKTEMLLGTYRDQQGNNKFTYHPEYKIPYSDTLIGIHETEIESLNTEMSRQSYETREAARYPILSYAFGSIGYWFTYEGSLFERFFAVRMINVFWAVAIVYFSYKLGALVFEDRSLALMVGSLVGLQPMLRFLNAGINSDNLHIAICSAFLYVCAKILLRGWQGNDHVKAGVLLGLDFITKPQAYILIGIFGLMIAMRLLKSQEKLKEIRYGAMAGITCLLLSAWQEIPRFWNFWHGSSAFLPNVSMNPAGEFLPFLQFSLHKLYTQNIVWYWGVFKWLGVVLPRPIWWITNRLVLLAGLGVFLIAYKGIKKQETSVRLELLLFLLGATLMYVAAIFYFDWQHFLTWGYSFGVQGRYYLPMIASQMTLLLAGIGALLPWKRATWFMGSLLVGWFLIMHVVAVWTVLKIYYDLSSTQSLLLQISQYKPDYAKGYAWGFFAMLGVGTWLGYIYLLFNFVRLALGTAHDRLNYENTRV